LTSVSETEDARLQRLLGGAGLASLRRRLRARYERGETRDEFTLGALAAEERRALEALLGRPARSARSIRMRQSELDAIVARAGLAPDLRGALEALDGPLVDRKGERTARERRWCEVLDAVEDARLRAFFADAANVALLRRLAASDPERGGALLARAALVFARLPAFGVPLARLAAETLGDAHALDAGAPVAALVLRAAAWLGAELGASPAAAAEANVGSRVSAASRRDQWALVGVSVNDLAAPVLCLSLRADSGTPAGAIAARAAELGTPVHLSLRALLKSPPTWRLAQRGVYVCENSALIAAAADRFGAKSPPAICTDGMPGAAQQALLRQIAAQGGRLRYHGDFDWPGLAIGNFVIRSFGATPWRFGAADYRAGAGGELALSGRRVEAAWDRELTDAMTERGSVVHEEAVMESLLADLAAEAA
jgi:uncharacterized protein (TIGR02679 family)